MFHPVDIQKNPAAVQFYPNAANFCMTSLRLVNWVVGGLQPPCSIIHSFKCNYIYIYIHHWAFIFTFIFLYKQLQSHLPITTYTYLLLIFQGNKFSLETPAPSSRPPLLLGAAWTGGHFRAWPPPWEAATPACDVNAKRDQLVPQLENWSQILNKVDEYDFISYI